MYILNGKTPGDLVGKVTCKNINTVYYCICTPSLFCNVDNLHVHDFCTLLSDVHNPIIVGFLFSCDKSSLDVNSLYTEKNPNARLSEPNKSDVFINNLDMYAVDMILQDLNNLQQTNTLNNAQVNDVVDKIGLVFANTASKSFSKPTHKITDLLAKVNIRSGLIVNANEQEEVLTQLHIYIN